MFEGQPTLLCEASALGVPSIFPETGGISEFFPDNYPLAYEQFNYEELEGQIKKLNDLDFVKNVGNSNKDYIKNLLDEEQLYEDLKKYFHKQFKKLSLTVVKIYLNKPKEDWIVDRFVDEWNDHNKSLTTKIFLDLMLFGSLHHGLGEK